MQGSRRPIAAIADDLSRVIEHFAKLGFDIRRGRIAVYADALARAANGKVVDRGILWSAACETEDLVDAASHDEKVLHFVRDRIKALCGGDPVFTETSELDQGRNLCFELVTASMLQKISGIPSALQSPTDAVNVVAGQTLLVECKRPSTLKGLARCIAEGYRQLSEHRRSGATGVGALAIEVTALINPQFGVLVAPDREQATAALDGHILRLFASAKEELARAARNSREDAGVQLMMFRAKCMTGDGLNPPDVTTVWQAQPMVPLDSPEFAALYRHVSRLPTFTPGVVVAQ